MGINIDDPLRKIYYHTISVSLQVKGSPHVHAFLFLFSVKRFQLSLVKLKKLKSNMLIQKLHASSQANILIRKFTAF